MAACTSTESTEDARMPAVSDLDTPAVTIHLDIMERNIAKVQRHLAAQGLRNRPHIKTHKIPALGKLQMAGGAVGITCQKIGEVEGFAAAGVADDVLLRNRPHIKTHKIPALGKLQMAGGAVGITCQKIGEVEVFAAAGVADDVLL